MLRPQTGIERRHSTYLPASVRFQLAAIASLQSLRLASGVMALGLCEVGSAHGPAGIQLHAEHPQAAKVLSASQTICLAMAEHSPTSQGRVSGHSRAGLQWEDVGALAHIEYNLAGVVKLCSLKHFRN
jgi:hypothetical protein